MKRLLGAAVAIAGLFVGGSTVPVELDYISYKGAPIVGYGGSANFGPPRSVLSAGHGGLAEFIDRGPERMFAALTEGSSASASEPLQAKEQPSSLQAREQPSQPNVQSAYEPDVPLSTLNDVSGGFPVGGPLLGETRDGQENPSTSKSKTAGNGIAASKKSAAEMSGKRAAAHTHPTLTTPRETGCTQCSGSQWSSHPKSVVALLSIEHFRKRSRVRREHLPTGIARVRDAPILAAWNFPHD